MRPRHTALAILIVTSGIGVVLRGFAAPGSSGQWTAAGSLIEARAGAAAVLLADGRVLVTGGTTASGPTSRTDAYSSGAGFGAVAPMLVARSDHAAVRLLDGRVLVTGGTTADGATDSAELYDPASGAWTAASPMVEPRARHSASLLADGRVLIAGGAHAGAASATLEIFDPVSAQFRATASIMSPRAGHAAATLADGRVLLAGGVNGETALASIDIFDPAGESVAQATLSGPRAGLSATRLLDGTVLIAGGRDGEHDLASAEVFDPVTGVSTVVGAMSAPRSDHQAFLLPDNNSVLIVGGTRTGGPVATSELFLPWIGEFRTTGDLAQARLAASGAPLAEQGGLVVAGGSDGQAALAGAERYAFATVRTDADDYAPGQTVTITGEGWEPGETVSLVLHEAPHTSSHEDRTLTAVVDVNGRIFNNEFAPEPHDLGVRFYLTVVGTVSQAQMTFTDGELLTTELVGAVNDVTVSQGASANFAIRVSATGALKCTATAANPATATVRTLFAISSTGVLTSSTPSAPLAFFAGAPMGGGTNCDTTWTGAPTAYSVAASVSAAAATPVGDYTITLSAPAGTTAVSTPPGSGGSLADAAATTITVHVIAASDSTPPVITPTVSGTAGSNGWYVSDVTVSWSVTDPQSSISSSTGCETTTVTADTAGTTLTCSATSGGGAASQSVTVKVDKTGPDATLSVTAGTAGANGWYTSDVTVHTSGSDPTSGPVTCTADQQQTAETTGTPFNGSCTNDAGLTSDAAPLSVKMDKTGPSAALSVTAGTPGANGWFTSDVTVHASGSDAISGPVTCTADQQQTAETAATPFNGSCTNDAGLTTSAAPLIVKLDKTAPTAALAATGVAGLNGWFRGDVTVTTSGADSISGPVDCTGPQYQTADTTGTAFNGACTNLAGLVRQAAALTVKLDKTPPQIALLAPVDGGGYVLNASVAASYSCQDATSGPAACNGAVASGSPVSTAPVGPKSFTVTATDYAGNSATQTNSYTVLFGTGSCLGEPGRAVLQPINMDGTSVFKQRSTVPVKFRVCDANGVSIGSNVVSGFALVQVSAGTTISTVNEPVDSTTPDVSFRWDASSQQWIFNTNTKSLLANRTYGFVITLTDGTTIAYQFGLK